MTSVENSQPSAFNCGDVDNHPVTSAPGHLDHGNAEQKHVFTEEEVKSILEVIASTGKFWHDWDILKEILSFRLKQVLAQYPESQMLSDVIGPQPSSLSGETYQDLVKRLDEALLGFIEGPPFTLQRLCEILLTPQSIYSNLSKLALALEKNLLVTSTLTICTEPYPTTTTQKLAEPEEGNLAPQAHPNTIENGVEPIISDGDEDMMEAEPGPEAEADENDKHVDMDDAEGKINEKSETGPESTAISDHAGETSVSNEQISPVTS